MKEYTVKFNVIEYGVSILFCNFYVVYLSVQFFKAPV